MATLNPAPTTLGLVSPALGPWFSDPNLTLPPPGPDLSVPLTIGPGVNWLPPAGGLLSFFVAEEGKRPAGLARFRKADGGLAFSPNRIVAVFRLLPEVEDRLDTLVGIIPPADGSAVNPAVPSRARVRYFAVELPDTMTNITALAD
ncbi:MAG TPA: hypothetical protein VKE74_32295, partial [Gemmataceae bacterium]|nr:hypothetical protein [Gemmataceae bacterium]